MSVLWIEILSHLNNRIGISKERGRMGRILNTQLTRLCKICSWYLQYQWRFYTFLGRFFQSLMKLVIRKVFIISHWIFPVKVCFSPVNFIPDFHQAWADSTAFYTSVSSVFRKLENKQLVPICKSILNIFIFLVPNINN